MYTNLELENMAMSYLEPQGRKLMFLVLTGSRAWGTEDEHSDWDIKGVYLETTENILKVNKPKDCMVFTDNNVDMQLYELEKYLCLIRKNNAGIINLLFSPWIVKPTNSILELGKKFLTKNLRFYYRGVVISHKNKAIDKRNAKELIAAYKEILQGIYLMIHREVWFDFAGTYDALVREGYLKEFTLMLNAIIKHDIKTLESVLNGYSAITLRDKIESDFEYLFDIFDAVAEASILSDDFDGLDEINSMLLRYRRWNVKNGMF